MLLAALFLLAVLITWRTGLLRRHLLGLRDWLLWSQRRALMFAAALAVTFGLLAATAVGGGSPDDSPTATKAGRTITAADSSRDPDPSPAVSPSVPAGPSKAERDGKAVVERTRKWVGLFLDGRTTDSPEQWRARLQEQSVPSMGMYLAVTPPFAVPDATITQVFLDELLDFEAITSTFLSDGSEIELRLTFNGQRWLVSDYLRPPAE